MSLKQYILDKIVQAVLPILVDRAASAIAQGVAQGVAKALESKAEAKVLELTNQEVLPVSEVQAALGLAWPTINHKE